MLRPIFHFVLFFFTLEAYSQEHYCSHSTSFQHQSFQSQITDERLNQYDVKHVFLDLNADNTSTQISGKTTLLLVSKDNISILVLELVGELTISSVGINGESAAFTHSNDLIEINLPVQYQAGELIECTITYSGNPVPEPGIFSGINNARSGAWGNQVTWTLSEPFNAKMWWPCKQVLTDKIDSVWVFVTTDNHLKVGSNGLLTNEVSLPNGQTRYEWKSNYPIAYYLISMTIAEYVEYNNYAKPEGMGQDSLLIQNYIYNNPETLPYYKDELDEVPEMVELFSDHYGLYPFHKEKYGHVMAPFSGGMEHQTMSSMGIFTFSLDAHELAHQWFGNSVTCATWQDIWINEGFARFSEYLAIEKILSEQNALAYRLDDMASVLGTLGGSVYVPEDGANDEDRIFNFRLTYQKGGLILHMIRNIVNDDDLFFQTFQSYLEQYKDSTASGNDFRKLLEVETGLQFDNFFSEWYYGEGYPVFDITWQKRNDTLRLNIDQATTFTTSLFTTPMEFEVSYENGETEIFRVSQSKNQEEFNIPVSGAVANLAFDPDRWLIKKVKRIVQLDDGGEQILGFDHQEKLVFYPNPASEELFFSGPAKKIRISDTSGKIVLAFIGGGPFERINIRSLRAGIYFLMAEGDEGIIKKKFIKH